MEKLNDLKGKKVSDIYVGGQVLKIKFEDGTSLECEMASAPGADLGWYQWFDVILDGTRIHHG